VRSSTRRGSPAERSRAHTFLLFSLSSYTFDTTSASQDKVKVIEEYEGNKIIGGGELLHFTPFLSGLSSR